MIRKAHDRIVQAGIITLALALLIPASVIVKSSGPKPGFSDYSQGPNTLFFSLKDFTFTKIGKYDLVEMPTGDYTHEYGKPMLPLKTLRFALPPDMQATTISILTLKEIPITGTYDIYPAQPPTVEGSPSPDAPVISQDKTIYTLNAIYPADYITLQGETDLAGQAMAEITIYPIHYNPTTGQLFLTTDIVFTIKGTGGYIYRDYLAKKTTQFGIDEYTHTIKRLVYNPAEVMLQINPNPHPSPLDELAPGAYDYVIVTPQTWAASFQPLANWKTLKGISTTIVTVEWINSQPDYTGDNQNKLRMFVADAHAAWGTQFVLLGGDSPTPAVKFQTFTVQTTNGPMVITAPTDWYYADCDGDWTTEASVGRASVTNTAEITTFVNKILLYEQNPPLTDYAKKAALFGFDLDTETHGQNVKSYIDTQYIPDSWTVTTVYDSQGGDHRQNVINAINAGQNLINHHDHGDYNNMCTGWTNHQQEIGSGTVDAFTNGNKQSIVFTCACQVNGFDQAECIGEHFVRNANGGAVEFIGCSQYGFYSHENNQAPFGAGPAYDCHFFQALFTEGYTTTGAALAHSKDIIGHWADVYQYLFNVFTILGDPTLLVRLDNPTSLSVSYANPIPNGQQNFQIHVQSGTQNVQNALVCLIKENEVYATSVTNANGDASIPINPTSAGTMSVTVTHQNYLPFQGSTWVTSSPILIYSPNGGEITTRGSDLFISWTTNIYQPPHNEADIWISGDSGATWTFLLTVPQTQGYNQYTIPITDTFPVFSNHCRIVVGTHDGILDCSDNDFVIWNTTTAPSVFYVDDSNTGGPWDGSSQYPFQTIQSALASPSVQAGALVLVRPGYYGTGSNGQPMDINKAVSIVGLDVGTTIINCWPGQPQNNDIVQITANWANLSGFTVYWSSIMADSWGANIKVMSQHSNVSYNRFIRSPGGQNTKRSGDAIIVTGSNNIISHNTMSDYISAGIVLSSCSGNIVDSNTIIQNMPHWSELDDPSNDGIYLMSASGNTISNNQIYSQSGCWYMMADNGAISLWSSNGNTIVGNTLDGQGGNNRDSGVWMIGSSDNIICYNTIKNYTESFEPQIGLGTGLTINQLGSELSNNNHIYRNKFYNNIQNTYAYAGCTSQWDDGYLHGGNYYDDNPSMVDNLSGPDHSMEGPDGLCDSTYNIRTDGSIQDHYPLTTPDDPNMIENAVGVVHFIHLEGSGFYGIVCNEGQPNERHFDPINLAPEYHMHGVILSFSGRICDLIDTHMWGSNLYLTAQVQIGYEPDHPDDQEEQS